MNGPSATDRLDWLRLTRGPAHFLVPAAWVRRVSSIERPEPLPLAEPLVLGLAQADDGHWLPVVDPLAAAGIRAPRKGVAALLAEPGGEACAWLLADGPGVLSARPDGHAAPLPDLPCLRALPNRAGQPPTWIWDAPAWAAALSAR